MSEDVLPPYQRVHDHKDHSESEVLFVFAVIETGGKHLTYPVIREKGSLYIFAPCGNELELCAVYERFDAAGLLDPWDVGSEMFDTSCLEYFANLEEVKLTGFELAE